MPPLEASRPLPTIFVGSSMGLSFWAKAIGFHFVNFFGMCKRSNMLSAQHQTDVRARQQHVQA